MQCVLQSWGTFSQTATCSCLQCREECVQNSGPLGKEGVANEEVEAVKAEL